MTIRYLTPDEQAFAVWLLARPELLCEALTRALQHWPIPIGNAAQQERRDLKYARAWLQAAKDGNEG